MKLGEEEEEDFVWRRRRRRRRVINHSKTSSAFSQADRHSRECWWVERRRMRRSLGIVNAR